MATFNAVPGTQQQRRGFVVAILAMCCLTAATASCSRPPQYDSQHWDVIEALQTAVSSSDEASLLLVARSINARRANGELTEEQFAALDKALQLARNGEWNKAQAWLARIAEAQEPTAEDRERLMRREVVRKRTDSG